MKTTLRIFYVIGLIALGALDGFCALGITNLPATNITTTSAYFRATITGTNTANPTNWLFYGTIDRTNNESLWAYSNFYGVAGIGNLSTQITALSPLHKYYFRWRASDSTTSIWTSVTSNFWTKPSAPTTTPAVVTISLQTDTNGVLKAPTNFFNQNSNLIISSIGLSSYLTNESLWIAASNNVVYTNTPAYTNAVALAGTALQSESDPVWVAVTSLYAQIGLSGGWTNLSEYNNDIDYATGTPVYVESDPIWGADSNSVLSHVSGDTVTSNTGNWQGTWQGLGTNIFVNTNDPAYLAAWTNGTLTEGTSNSLGIAGRILNLTIRTNYAGADSMTNLVNAYASTGSASYAAQILTITHGTNYVTPGANGTWTNLSEYNNDAGFITNESLWSSYPATQNVNMAGGDITNGTRIKFTGATVGKNYSIAVGEGASIGTAGTCIALGHANIASGTGSVALGQSSRASNSYSVVLGAGINVTHGSMGDSTLTLSGEDGVYLLTDAQAPVVIGSPVDMSSNPVTNASLMQAITGQFNNLPLLASHINTSNRVSVLETNTPSLQSYLSTSGTVSIISTQLFAGATTTGRITSASGDTNNYLRGDGAWATPAGAGDFLADGTVPMTGTMDLGSNSIINANNITSTGLVSMAALQITSGSPTNGALFKATNTAGQGAWTIYPKIKASLTTAQIYPGNATTNVIFPTVVQQQGGTWDGTSWTPGVVGWVSGFASGAWTTPLTALATIYVQKNGTAIAYHTQPNDYNWEIGWADYCESATNKYKVVMFVYSITHTNDVNSSTTFVGMMNP